MEEHLAYYGCVYTDSGALNILVNFLNHFNINIWLLFTLKITEIDTATLIYKTMISFLNSFGEILLMLLTAETIDFRYYIVVLLMGRGRMSLASNISVFLKLRRIYMHSPNNSLMLSEDESDEDLDFQFLAHSDMDGLKSFETPKDNNTNLLQTPQSYKLVISQNTLKEAPLKSTFPETLLKQSPRNDL